MPTAPWWGLPREERRTETVGLAPPVQILAARRGLALQAWGELSLPIEVKSVTSIAAGPGVRGQAVRGTRGEADVDTPAGRAEALCGALARFFQIRAALVHL